MSASSDDEDPVDFLLRRAASPPIVSLVEPEPEPEPELQMVEAPAAPEDAESLPVVAAPGSVERAAQKVPSWLASLPDGRVGPSGKVDFAYHSLDNISIVRAMHWLLAQRRFVRSLHLQCNAITLLSDWVGQLTALEELHLSHNQLTSLPASLGRLVHLRKLCVDHNQLAALPECLRLLDKLEDVEVENNPLSSPPIEVCRDGVGSINAYFARRMEARQRLAFACASHARLGARSHAGRRNLDADALRILGGCRALQGSAFVPWRRQVAQLSEEEAGRLNDAEVEQSRHQLLAVESAGWLTKRGAVVKNWKARWCTLSMGELSYFEGVNTLSLEHVLEKKTHSIAITGESNARGKIDLLDVYHIHSSSSAAAEGEGEGGSGAAAGGPPTIELSTVGRA
jgi:hypothetical protein